MNNESAKVIISLIGVAGLILYGYLIFMSDISADYQKYTVLAASLGVLYPLGALSDNEYLSGNGYKAFGIGLLGACVILFAGYASKIDTEDGLIWDFFKAITTEGYRYFYFFLLLVANILPLVSKKYSIWLSAFTVGIMIPVLIASVLALAIIVGVLSALGASGKSNGSSNSWSSIFSGTSGTNTKSNKEETSIMDSSQPSEPLFNFKIEWDHSDGSRLGPEPISYTQYIRLPRNSSYAVISKALKKMHGSNAKVLRYTIEP